MSSAHGRMHGERVEMYNARRAFAVEAAIATRAKELEYELKRREGIALPTVQIEPPCTCPKFPFPHFHGEEEQRRSVMRFRRRFAPLYGSNGKVIESNGRSVLYFGGGGGDL